MLKHPNYSLQSSLPPIWLITTLFTTTIVFYLFTLNPSLFRNDSPETIVACITLGISHPPGYPLHTMIGRLFSFLPIGNPAFTLNFFSAVLSAIGVCLLATNLWVLLASSVQGRRTNSFQLSATCLVTALYLAFSGNYWSASLSAKGGIYILQVVLLLLFLLHLQLQHQRSKTDNPLPRQGHLLFLGFLFAIGLTNHWPTQSLLAPALFVLYFITPRFSSLPPFRLKHCISLLTIFLLVTSLYLFLPLRSILMPELNFGAPFTSSRFIDSLLRSNYSKIETLLSANSGVLSSIAEKADYISHHILDEFHPLFLILVALGTAHLFRRKEKSFLLFLLVLVLTTWIANLLYLQIKPIEYWHMDDHLLNLNWALAFLGGCGSFFLFQKSMEYPKFKSRPITASSLSLALPIFLVVLIISNHLPVNDQKREFLYYGYGLKALNSMQENALYFAESDYDYFSLLYLRQVENKRPSLSFFSTSFLGTDHGYELIRARYPDIPFPGSAKLDEKSFFRFIQNQPRPIYSAFPNGSFSEMLKRHSPLFSYQPIGTVTQFHPYSRKTPLKFPIDPLDDLWEKYLAPGKRSTNPINGLLMEICAHPFLNSAQYLRSQGDLSQWDRYFDRGLSLIKERTWLAEEWAKRAEVDFLLNKKELALYALEKARELDPANPTLQRLSTRLNSSSK